MSEQFKLYNGKVTLNFNSDNHLYTVSDGNQEKKTYGVTNITGIVNKPGLMFWAVDQAIKQLELLLKPGIAYDEVQIKEMLASAKEQHTATKNKAADIGTMIHEWVSSYINACINKEKLPSKPMNKQMKAAVEGFLTWQEAHKVQWISSERKIYSIKYNYAGTLDAEAIIDGKLCVVDLKTGNSIYDEYFMQVAAYLYARKEESPDQKFEGVHILRLAKDAEVKGKPVPAFEDREATDIQRHFRGFLGCLLTYTWQQQNVDIAHGLKPTVVTAGD